MSHVQKFSLSFQQRAILTEIGISLWQLQPKLPEGFAVTGCEANSIPDEQAEYAETPKIEVLDRVLLDIEISEHCHLLVDDLLLQLDLVACERVGVVADPDTCRFIWSLGEKILVKGNHLQTPILNELMSVKGRRALWQAIQQLEILNVYQT